MAESSSRFSIFMDELDDLLVGVVGDAPATITRGIHRPTYV